jgi:hypothetical protein
VICEILATENRGGRIWVTVAVTAGDAEIRLTMAAPSGGPFLVGGLWELGLTKSVRPVPKAD